MTSTPARARQPGGRAVAGGRLRECATSSLPGAACRAQRQRGRRRRARAAARGFASPLVHASLADAPRAPDRSPRLLVGSLRHRLFGVFPRLHGFAAASPFQRGLPASPKASAAVQGAHASGKYETLHGGPGHPVQDAPGHKRRQLFRQARTQKAAQERSHVVLPSQHPPAGR